MLNNMYNFVVIVIFTDKYKIAKIINIIKNIFNKHIKIIFCIKQLMKSTSFELQE